MLPQDEEEEEKVREGQRTLKSVCSQQVLSYHWLPSMHTELGLQRP